MTAVNVVKRIAGQENHAVRKQWRCSHVTPAAAKPTNLEVL